MNFPFLSVITFTPAVAGLLILLIPAERKTETRMAALAAGLFATILSLYVYFGYDQAAGGYQFIEQYLWVHRRFKGRPAPLADPYTRPGEDPRPPATAE